MAGSVSTRPRQEVDFQRDGAAGQSQLAATTVETRSRPSRVARDRDAWRAPAEMVNHQFDRRHTWITPSLATT
jgi:hypothetical protein